MALPLADKAIHERVGWQPDDGGSCSGRTTHLTYGS
jgi:hypothetical protein